MDDATIDMMVMVFSGQSSSPTTTWIIDHNPDPQNDRIYDRAIANGPAFTSARRGLSALGTKRCASMSSASLGLLAGVSGCGIVCFVAALVVVTKFSQPSRVSVLLVGVSSAILPQSLFASLARCNTDSWINYLAWLVVGRRETSHQCTRCHSRGVREGKICVPHLSCTRIHDVVAQKSTIQDCPT